MRANEAYRIATEKRRKDQKEEQQRKIDHENAIRDKATALFKTWENKINVSIGHAAEDGEFSLITNFDDILECSDLVDCLITHYNGSGYKVTRKLDTVGGSDSEIHLIIDWADE